MASPSLPETSPEPLAEASAAYQVPFEELLMPAPLSLRHVPRLVRPSLASTGEESVSSPSSPSPTQILKGVFSKTPELSGRPPPRTRYSSDRFIPASASVNSFRMGSPASSLNSEERLLRRTVQPTASRDRSRSPERNIHTSSYHTGLSPGGMVPSPTNTRVSAGGRDGVFGIAIGAQARIDPPVVPRSYGRRVDGGISSSKESPEAEMERHQRRVSAALGVDRSARVLDFTATNSRRQKSPDRSRAVLGIQGETDELWRNTIGTKDVPHSPSQSSGKSTSTRKVAATPFRVLDAPGLRDDYYCSLLAYSGITHSLAVGLHTDVYNWTEANGARPFDHHGSSSNAHVTSLAFSSFQGGRNILAIGRIDGRLSLWNPTEPSPRVELYHSAGVACLAWRPVVGRNPLRLDGVRGAVPLNGPPGEELLVGDEIGTVFYYRAEWEASARTVQAAPGASLSLMRRIIVHTQQICGLAWSCDGEQFVTGGNDNVAFLFALEDVVGVGELAHVEPRAIDHDVAKYRWQHGAAVKAIAFCPWQNSLVATGGGSNDRCIHFFHSYSGATLATIDVSAQVTSLLWSNSHREIAATFGYANPDHPIRIAVFSWPECRQVVQVAWGEEMRALYAVAYPGGPSVSEGSASRGSDDDEQDELESLVSGRSPRRCREHRRFVGEGCIVVAASDETVRFHEVWSDDRKGVLGWRGMLGGSDILEGLEGIDRDGAELIR